METDIDNIGLIDSASRVLEQLNTPLLKQAKQKAVVYLSPISAVTPVTLPTARRLVIANAISGLLSRLGYDVYQESLMDDSPELLKTLRVSIWLRYLELCGEAVNYPDGCYQGDYIFDFAASIHRNHGNRWAKGANKIIHSGSNNSGYNQSNRQAIHERMRQYLDEEGISVLAQTGIRAIAGDIKNDLQDLTVSFTSNPTGREFIAHGMFEKILANLQAKGLVRVAGAKRYLTLPGTNQLVLLEDDEPSAFCLQLTHILSAYQKDSDLFICIYDIDQEEQIQQVKHCAQTLGLDLTKWIDKPVKAPRLSEDGDLVHTSPLSEDYVSFREARQTIGLDCLRFIFLRQKTSDRQQIESLDSPPEGWLPMKNCFSYLKNFQDRYGETFEDDSPISKLAGLNEEQRLYIRPFVHLLRDLPDVFTDAKDSMEPAVLVRFLQNLCEGYLSYYNNHVVAQESQLENADADNAVINPVDALLTNCLAYVFAVINKTLGQPI